MTQEPHPALDTMPVHIGLARLAAALTAWDTGTGRSSAMAGAGAVGGAGAGSSPAQGARGGTASAGPSEIPPARTLT